MKSKALFNKNFFLLWLGQSVSQLGNGAGYIALIWWIQTETGSALALGTLAMIKGLVAVSIAPFAGALVDRLNRKTVIVFTDILQGCIYALFTFLLWQGHLTLPVIYIGSALSTAINAFFSPAISAAVPLIVPHKDLTQANALRQISQNIVQIVSYAAGGIIVAFLGVPIMLLIDAITFILSAISEIFITIPAIQQKSIQKKGLNLIISDIKEAIIYVKNNHLLFSVMKLAMILNFFFAPFFILLPKFVNEYMGANSMVFGYLLSSEMAGILCGNLVLSVYKITEHHPWTFRWGIVIQSALLCLFALYSGSYWQIYACLLFIIGFFNCIVNISFSTAMQLQTKQEYMGKVFGLISAMSGGLQPAAQGLAGAIATYISIPVIFIGSGLTTIIAGTQFALIPNIMSLVKPQESAVS